MTPPLPENPQAVSSFILKLTTAKGTVYHYGPLEADSPDGAAALALGARGQDAAELRPCGDARWERTEADGARVLVWADRRRLATPAAPYRRLLWVHL